LVSGLYGAISKLGSGISEATTELLEHKYGSELG